MKNSSFYPNLANELDQLRGWLAEELKAERMERAEMIQDEIERVERQIKEGK